jgi:hypothetical protein
LPALRRAARHCNGLESRVRDSCLYEPAGRNSSPVTGKSASLGEGPTGPGAERELGFDPQSKAELAQGEYKGAREVLARHVHTAEPRGAGWPVARGGC